MLLGLSCETYCRTVRLRPWRVCCDVARQVTLYCKSAKRRQLANIHSTVVVRPGSPKMYVWHLDGQDPNDWRPVSVRPTPVVPSAVSGTPAPSGTVRIEDGPPSEPAPESKPGTSSSTNDRAPRTRGRPLTAEGARIEKVCWELYYGPDQEKKANAIPRRLKQVIGNSAPTDLADIRRRLRIMPHVTSCPLKGRIQRIDEIPRKQAGGHNSRIVSPYLCPYMS